MCAEPCREQTRLGGDGSIDAKAGRRSAGACPDRQCLPRRRPAAQPAVFGPKIHHRHVSNPLNLVARTHVVIPMLAVCVELVANSHIDDLVLRFGPLICRHRHVDPPLFFFHLFEMQTNAHDLGPKICTYARIRKLLVSTLRCAPSFKPR